MKKLVLETTAPFQGLPEPTLIEMNVQNHAHRAAE